MTMPDPDTVILPVIQYKPPKSAWGKNFTRLDTEPVWYHMTDETRANILSQDTVRIGLKYFAKEMTASRFKLDKLFAKKVSRTGHSWIKTRKPLSDRIQMMYQNRWNSDRGSNYGYELKAIDTAITTHINREQGASYKYWKDNPLNRGKGRRLLATQLAQEHGKDPFWMMYGLSVALRIIEALLCQGYVIVIMGQGRFWVRNVPDDFKFVEEGHRVVFQAEKDFGWPYKKPAKYS